jgi:hypothetical protein
VPNEWPQSPGIKKRKGALWMKGPETCRWVGKVSWARRELLRSREPEDMGSVLGRRKRVKSTQHGLRKGTR